MNTRIPLVALGAATIILISSQLSAQVCKPNSIPAAAPNERYLDNGDGTVLDVSTGLVWKKCSLGQNYSDGQCAGTPISHTWKDALAAAASEPKDTATGKSWRVPTTKELETLVERQCHDPAINESMFPGTPSGIYLSSTPGFTPGTPRVMDFRTGIEVTPPVSTQRFVRLVRDAGELQDDLY